MTDLNYCPNLLQECWEALGKFCHDCPDEFPDRHGAVIRLHPFHLSRGKTMGTLACQPQAHEAA